MIERLTTKHKTRRTEKPEWIIVHYTGCLASPCLTCDAMAANEKSKASTHYIVFNNDIVHCVDETKYYAWHCATSGKKTYCAANNRNSIGVDLVPRKLNAKSLKATDKDWYFDEETMRTAASLIRELMTKFDIDIDHVVRHYDVTHKLCPRPFVGNDANSVWGRTGNDAWERFKRMIEAQE
ncbi:MAG: N-acetylmuramoyl-L-alanine amidase [Proteobacteria bacterium]|nr:N-acetylmuramoyl-L-alanine amidase [Pseudomonadota bacterium]